MKAKSFLQYDGGGFIDNKATGAKVRQYRELHKLSLKEVGTRMRCSEATVSRMETGHIKWTPRRMERFLDACRPRNGSSRKTLSKETKH